MQELEIGFPLPIAQGGSGLPIGSMVVPFCGSYLGSYQVIPKRNYLGAYG